MPNLLRVASRSLALLPNLKMSASDSPSSTDHFPIADKLGGGMGVVYKAEHLEIGRPIVLKFLPDAAQDKQHVLFESGQTPPLVPCMNGTSTGWTTLRGESPRCLANQDDPRLRNVS